MGWLLQWAVGLRAAVSIASERERGTWDALLMSPLEPGEIVRAKLFGSLYALRWMVGAMILAWTLAVVVGAVSRSRLRHMDRRQRGRPAPSWPRSACAARSLSPRRPRP